MLRIILSYTWIKIMHFHLLHLLLRGFSRNTANSLPPLE